MGLDCSKFTWTDISASSSVGISKSDSFSLIEHCLLLLTMPNNVSLCIPSTLGVQNIVWPFFLAVDILMSHKVSIVIQRHLILEFNEPPYTMSMFHYTGFDVVPELCESYDQVQVQGSYPIPLDLANMSVDIWWASWIPGLQQWKETLPVHKLEYQKLEERKLMRKVRFSSFLNGSFVLNCMVNVCILVICNMDWIQWNLHLAAMMIEQTIWLHFKEVILQLLK